MPRRNDEAAQLLETIAKLLIIKQDDPYRIRAYLNAALTLRGLRDDVGDLHRAGRLQELPGIGPGIAARIGEFLDTGWSPYVETLKHQIPLPAADLLEVPGIGPVRAELLHQHLGITTVEELAAAARAGRVRQVPGFGERLEALVGREAERVQQRRRQRKGAA